MGDESATERAVVQSLRALLSGAPIDGELWLADHEGDVVKRLLDALERFLPQALAEAHPFWRHESLDAFCTVRRRKVAERRAEIFGLALLISDQRWIPFELTVTISATEDRVDALRCRIGSAGAEGGGLDRRFPWSERAAALRAFTADRERVPWVFGVCLDGEG